MISRRSMSASSRALDLERRDIVKFLEVVQMGFDPEFAPVAFATSCEKKTNYEPLIIGWLETGNTFSDKFIRAVKEEMDAAEIALLDKALQRLVARNTIERRILDPKDLAAQISETNKKCALDSYLGYYLTDSYKKDPIKKQGFYHPSYRPVAFFDD